MEPSYPLRITDEVKKTQPRRLRGSTRVSAKNQVTIPVAALRDAGLEPGDIVRVEATGSGRVVLTRLADLIDQYAGALDTGGSLRDRVNEVRDEWR